MQITEIVSFYHTLWFDILYFYYDFITSFTPFYCYFFKILDWYINCYEETIPLFSVKDNLETHKDTQPELLKYQLTWEPNCKNVFFCVILSTESNDNFLRYLYVSSTNFCRRPAMLQL